MTVGWPYHMAQSLYEIFKCAHLKFLVHGHNQAYTHFRKCSPASVGLAQACPNKDPMTTLNQ